MGMNTNQIAIGTGATLILAAGGRNGAVFKQKASGIDVFIGDVNVTLSNGHLLEGTKGASYSITGPDAYYAICAGGSPIITFSEQL